MSIFGSMLGRKFYSLIILALLIFAGCSRAIIFPQATATSPAPTPSFPPLDEAISTPLTSPIVQAESTVTITGKCIQIEEKIPDDLVLSGVWVRNEATPYLENLDEHVDYIVPLEGGGLLSTRNGDMAISPDRKYLAYIDKYYDPVNNSLNRRILRIIKSSGHSLPMDYWVEDWQWIIGWIDHQNIALFTGNKEIIILNPITGEWNKYQEPSWLDNINNNEYTYSYDSYYGPFYNPKLDRTIIKSDEKGFALRDLQSGEVIFRDTGYFSYSDFDWSDDSSILAIISGDGYILNILAYDQKIAEFDVRELSPDSATIWSIKLSPDGKKLIFTIFDHEAYGFNLYIFDISNSRISSLCTNEFELDSYGPLIWSPDSRFIVQAIRDANYKSTVRRPN